MTDEELLVIKRRANHEHHIDYWRWGGGQSRLDILALLAEVRRLRVELEETQAARDAAVAEVVRLRAEALKEKP